MKSAESKSSEKLHRDNSYKRPKKDQTSNSNMLRAPVRERNNAHSKSSKNSKDVHGSGNKLERLNQQQLPENIFGQNEDPIHKTIQEAERPIDLRNKKQQSSDSR
jgi:hypothetical protein